MLKLTRKGQSLIEYSLIIAVVVLALGVMQTYVKRGLSGKWKESVDQLGDQYDPRAGNTDIVHSLNSITKTRLLGVEVKDDSGRVVGVKTYRSDETNSIDSKTGAVRAGAY